MAEEAIGETFSASEKNVVVYGAEKRGHTVPDISPISYHSCCKDSFLNYFTGQFLHTCFLLPEQFSLKCQ